MPALSKWREEHPRVQSSPPPPTPFSSPPSGRWVGQGGGGLASGRPAPSPRRPQAGDSPTSAAPGLPGWWRGCCPSHPSLGQRLHGCSVLCGFLFNFNLLECDAYKGPDPRRHRGTTTGSGEDTQPRLPAQWVRHHGTERGVAGPVPVLVRTCSGASACADAWPLAGACTGGN